MPVEVFLERTPLNGPETVSTLLVWLTNNVHFDAKATITGSTISFDTRNTINPMNEWHLEYTTNADEYKIKIIVPSEDIRTEMVLACL